MKVSFRQSLTTLVAAGFALFATNALATDVDITLTVDNVYDVFISTAPDAAGTSLGTDNVWQEAETYTATLTPGVTNYIHVFAANEGGSGNPAGFLAELSLSDSLFEFPNGTQSLLTNTTDGWLVGATLPAAGAPVFIQDHGGDPWGVITDGITADPAISPDADWIWLDAEGPDQTQVVVFTVAIAPIEVDIDVSVVDSPDPVLAGSGTGNLTHTFTIENVSSEDATGVAINLLDASIPTGVNIVSIKDGADADITFPWTIGDLDAGDSVTATITLTVGLAAADGDVVSATVGLTAVNQVDNNSDNDSAVDPTTIVQASGLTSTFATSVVFTNGFEGTVTATLSCTAGLPLDQTAGISQGSPVTFTMTDLPFTTPGTTCEITATDVDGYTIEASANGGIAADSCTYNSTTFATDGANSCVFTATPNESEFAVDIDFDGIDDPAIDLGWTLDVKCAPAAKFETSTSFGLVTWKESGTGSDELLFTFYADPVNDTDCTATLSGLASAVEDDGPCTIKDIAVGEADDSTTKEDETPTCSVTVTAFYEGIPTLSQYGLAIMALLMLGVGFIGFRRFV